MENKVILVAETSKILSKFICAALKEKGLEQLPKPTATKHCDTSSKTNRHALLQTDSLQLSTEFSSAQL